MEQAAKELEIYKQAEEESVKFGHCFPYAYPIVLVKIIKPGLILLGGRQRKQKRTSKLLQQTQQQSVPHE